MHTIALQPRAESYVRQGRLDAAALASLRELQQQSEGGGEQASMALLFCLCVLQLWVSTEYLQPPPAMLGGSSAAAAGSEGVAEVVDLTAEEEPLSDPDGQLISLVVVRESQLAAAVKPDPAAATPAGEALLALAAEAAPTAAPTPGSAGGSAGGRAAAASSAASVAAGPAQRLRQQPPTLLGLPPSVLALIAAQLEQWDRARLATCCRTLLAASRACSSKWWPVLRFIYPAVDTQPDLVCYVARWLQRHEPAATTLHLTSSSVVLRGIPGALGQGGLLLLAAGKLGTLPHQPCMCAPSLAMLPCCPPLTTPPHPICSSGAVPTQLQALHITLNEHVERTHYPDSFVGLIAGPLLECCNAATLVVLSLRGCRLSHLPPQLSRLTALTALSLRRNELSYGARNTQNADFTPLAALTGLRRLDLSSQEGFFEIPPALRHLSQLQRLDVLGNPVSRGWRALFHLKQLTELRCHARGAQLPKKLLNAAKVGRLALQASGSCAEGWHPTAAESCWQLSMAAMVHACCHARCCCPLVRAILRTAGDQREVSDSGAQGGLGESAAAGGCGRAPGGGYAARAGGSQSGSVGGQF